MKSELNQLGPRYDSMLSLDKGRQFTISANPFPQGSRAFLSFSTHMCV